MPTYIITVLLDGGASAIIKEEATGIAPIETVLKSELVRHDDEFRLQMKGAVLSVKKDKVVGWTIDEA